MNRSFHIVLASCGLLLAPPLAAAPQPLTDTAACLAIDDAAFEKIEHLSLSLCEARKHPANPLLRNRPSGPDGWRAGFPWVLAENGRFRMWYLARDTSGEFFTCYAESADGYRWSYPQLGLVEHRGSKANNICYRGHTLFPQIYRDATATDPARRYMGVIFGQITGAQLDPAQRKRYGDSQPSIKCLAFSPDGLRWQEDHSHLFPIHAKVEGGTLFRLGGEWFMVHQQNVAEYPQVQRFSRFLSVSSSRDLRDWQLGEKPAFFFDPKYNGIIQTHVTPGYQNYGNVIVGAQGLFYDNVELLDHETDLILILSNDGRSWRQPKPAQPLSYLLRRGDRDHWDRSFIVQGNFVNTGSKTLLYYNGSQWGNADADGIQIGVAELRLDGYGSLAPHIGWDFGKEGPFEGTAISKPIALGRSGLRLYLNTEAGSDPRDEIRAELSDESGAIVRSFADCDALKVSSVGVPASWNGRAELDELAGKTVRVKIRIRSHNPQRSGKIRALEPQFYAFTFDTPKLLLGCEQAVFPSGVERQHISDPNVRALAADIRSAAPLHARLSAFDSSSAAITFAGRGSVRVRCAGVRGATFAGRTVAPEDGTLAFEATDGGVLNLTLSAK